MEEPKERKPPRIVLWAALCLCGYFLGFVVAAAFSRDWRDWVDLGWLIDLGWFVDTGGLLGALGLFLIACLLVMMVRGRKGPRSSGRV
jgi:uncharacterized membrane protein YfcA